MPKLPDTQKLTQHGRQVTTHGSEVLRCLWLGMKDALHPKLAFLSLVVGFVCLFVCVLLFWLFWESIWGQIAAFSLYLLSGWFSWLDMIPYFEVFLGFTFLLAGFMVLVILCARIILEVILMPRIQTHVLRHYPELSQSHESSIWVGIRNTLKMLPLLLLALPLLIIPVVGGVLFFLVVTFLNIRGLCFDALDSVAHYDEIDQIIENKRRPVLALGAVTGLFPLIPVVGLLTPVILGASATHYCFRRLHEIRTVPEDSAARPGTVWRLEDK